MVELEGNPNENTQLVLFIAYTMEDEVLSYFVENDGAHILVYVLRGEQRGPPMGQ